MKIHKDIATFVSMIILLIADFSTASEAREKAVGSAAASAACKIAMADCKTCTEGRLICAAKCREAKSICFPDSKNTSVTKKTVKVPAQNQELTTSSSSDATRR